MISASQNKCILECGIVHKSFSRCIQFQIKNIQEKFKFVDQFKVCIICLKYEKDCRCVSSANKNQFRKNCKHCLQNHHYLLCTTDNGLLHSLKIRNRFLGLTKKRRKRKRQKNYFPGQFVNGRHVVTITKPKGEIYTEGLYGYGTALGVKQPGCRGPEFRVASSPIKTEAETLNIKDCDPFMRPHPFAATSIEECLSEPSIQTSFDYNLVDIDVKKSDIGYCCNQTRTFENSAST